MPTNANVVPTPAMMELASGNYFDFEHPEQSVFTIKDIAQGLANTCRFSGQATEYYSVAEHTVRVSRYLQGIGYDVKQQLEGLHHDDSEAFITDVPRPIKILLPDYMALEQQVMDTILAGLGLEHLDVHAPEIKAADDWMLAQEAGEMLPSRGETWSVGWDGHNRALGWEPRVARYEWLERHQQLMRRYIDE